MVVLWLARENQTTSHDEPNQSKEQKKIKQNIIPGVATMQIPHVSGSVGATCL